jgi:hypothetical protein
VIIHLDLLAVRIGQRARKIPREFFARIFDGRIKSNAAMNLFYQNRPASRQLSGKLARRAVSFYARGT